MRLRHALLPAFALGLALLLAGPASGASTVRIRHADTGSFPLVQLTVSTETTQLAPGDVHITENGKPVGILSVKPFLEAGGGLDVVLAIDTSKSVTGPPLAAAVSAAKTFVDNLPAGVPVGVLTFSDQVRVILPPTPDHLAVQTELDKLTSTQPGTHLFDAVAEAAKIFTGNVQHNLVLLTDGADQGSTTDLDTAIKAVKKKRVTVFSIGLGGSQTDFSSLQAMASETGGTFAPATEEGLTAVYRSVAAGLIRQYIVLYRSQAPGGAEVTVKVTTNEGTDTSFIQMPRLIGGGDEKPGTPLLRGTWGFLVAVTLVFLGAFLPLFLVFGGASRRGRDKRLARRLGVQTKAAEGGGAEDERGLTAWIPEPLVSAGQRFAEMGRFSAWLERRLEQAGLPIRPGEVVAGCILASFSAGLVAGVAFRSFLIGIAVAVLAGVLPVLLLKRAVTKRIDALDTQLPDVLMILASSMRAGHSFMQALDTVSKEVGEPSGPEFARVVAEVRLGRKFEEAMAAMAERVGTEEFKWATLAVSVQREVGGNLAEVLDVLAETVREREAVRRQVKVLSAEGRLSIKILVAVPFAMALYISLVNPSYMRLLWTTRLGWLLIAVGAVFMGIGILIGRKVVKIDV